MMSSLRKCFCAKSPLRVTEGWVCAAREGKCGYDIVGSQPVWEEYVSQSAPESNMWWKQWVQDHIPNSSGSLGGFVPVWQVRKAQVLAQPSALCGKLVSQQLPQLVAEAQVQLQQFQQECETNDTAVLFRQWHDQTFAATTCATSLVQGGTAWHNERAFRLTASRFGTAAGHCGYDRHAKRMLQELVQPAQPTNRAQHNGIELQDIAETQYLARLTQRLALACMDVQNPLMIPKVRILHEGLFVSPDFPWLGGSVDGIVLIEHPLTGKLLDVGLVEYKCPSMGKFYVEKPDPTMQEGAVPHHYWDQIQGLMYLMHKRRWKPEDEFVGLPWVDFVVYIPQRGIHISRHTCNLSYGEELVRTLNTFYFQRFLPTYLRARVESVESM